MSIVDPAFPSRLRQLRCERGLSLRELSAASYVGKSTLSELENGRTRPSAHMARHLDQVLAAGGTLAGMVHDTPTSPDDRDRLHHAAEHPRQVDGQAVAALADLLAAQRRLDDLLPAHSLLPAVLPQQATARQIAQQAVGPHAHRARLVAAEWTQMVGWLYAEAGRQADAVRWLRDAADEADELDDGPLACQAADFLGYTARHSGQVRAGVRHCLTAYHTVGAAPLQRAQNAGHAAAGLAKLGDLAEARRLLNAATTLADGEDSAPETAYWLTPGFVRLGLGVAWLALGERATAADHLRSGLDGLPDGWADAEWAAEYRDALTAAVR